MGLGVEVDVEVGSGVCVDVAVGATVSVGVGVWVGASVGVDVGNGVFVGGRGVGVGGCTMDRLPSSQNEELYFVGYLHCPRV